MTKSALKSILDRKNGIAEMLGQALEYTKGSVWVEDANGMVLFGSAGPKEALAYPVDIEGETAGWVKSTKDAGFIAQLLNHNIGQEINRKKLGSELLHQYREINLIYTFSEKLSSVLSLETIAALILQEAGQIIRFSCGAVAYHDETSGEISLKAHAGSNFMLNLDWQTEDGFFREIALNGKSGITKPDVSVLEDEPVPLVLYASLKVRDRILGAIVFTGTEDREFSAADLKLLTTLASQAAAAMESTLLHEKATALALKAQREQLVFDLAQKHPFFKKVLSIIHANLSNPDFSVERLSKAMNLSPSQLQRKTIALADRTPVQIIRELRLQKAKELLRNPDLNVAEVAYQAGFNDPSYFTRLFTREMNMSPSVWKEKRGLEP